MMKLQGIGVSNGIAIAQAFLLVEPDLTVEKQKIDNPDEEKKRLQQAVFEAKQELEHIHAQTLAKLGEEEAAIFSAHLLVLQDPAFEMEVHQKIDANMNVEAALTEASEMFVQMFESMNDAYMRERAADIRDVSRRILAKLLQVELPNLNGIEQEVIIVANDLTPSMTVQLNKQFVKGFVTNIGGRTSHSAILARTLEIPAVVGVKGATEHIQSMQTIILNGDTGEVILNPTTEQIAQYEQLQQQFLEQQQSLAVFKKLRSVDKDGHQVELAVNIGSPSDVQAVIENGGDGIGLFRTEFLYMNRQDYPTEEEQFEAYKAVLLQMGDKPTVVRTLDIGGDKELPYLQFPHELNPFLGYRAIRICLDDHALFKVQMRALLRASVYGNLKIMFPMIATVEEFREAKAFLYDVKEQLKAEGIEVAEHIEIGLMVEVPSAAIMADVFAKEADFLSIGTNDLIQYTFAADRMNEKVAYLYQPYHPAILRLVKNVIDAGHANGCWIGMCGEMAGDKVAIPILLAMGLDEFSMSATSILTSRAQISKLSKKQLEPHISKILTLATSQEVEQYVSNYLK